jgi:hypothetical protein
VQELIRAHKQEEHEFFMHIDSLTWYMRGGLTRTEAFALSPDERRRIIKLISERIKIVEKTGLPLL